ncbi:MAG: metal ABC transporter permease [Bacillota bacterium]|uniref:metal ABC transporter permease n=1 Tax=Desulforudis sp. DRI-14 TaxID=3459793 RepID=UPI00346CAE29
MSAFGYDFMQYALLAGLLGGVACSLVGVLVVSMHLSFIGVCLSHAAFAGAVIAVFAGLNPLGGALVFSLSAAAAIGPLADRGEFNPDTSLGIVFTLMMGTAFLFMGLMAGPKTEVLGIMWGSILMIRLPDLLILAASALLATGVVVVFFKEIQALLFNREIAAAVGLPATWVFYGLLFLTGLTVAASLYPIGGLLVYSLILNPAAAAYQLTYDLRRVFVLAAVFGVLSCWTGLVTAYYADWPCGATIVIVSTLIFLLANWLSPKKKVKRFNEAQAGS